MTGALCCACEGCLRNLSLLHECHRGFAVSQAPAEVLRHGGVLVSCEFTQLEFIMQMDCLDGAHPSGE
jgi:hypothetical protein